MKYLIFIATLVLTVACNDHPRVVNVVDGETGEVTTDTLPYLDIHDFPEIAAEENIDTLIQGMIADTCVLSRFIGFGGVYTKEFASFERLTQLLNAEEWLALIEHPNPLVRLYAYRALQMEPSRFSELARQKLLTDTATVCIMSGCIRMIQPLNLEVKMMTGQ